MLSTGYVGTTTIGSCCKCGHQIWPTAVELDAWLANCYLVLIVVKACRNPSLLATKVDIFVHHIRYHLLVVTSFCPYGTGQHSIQKNICMYPWF